MKIATLSHANEVDMLSGGRRWELIALAASIFLATLWDFRLSGLRVFDIAALVPLAVLILTRTWRAGQIRLNAAWVMLAAVMAAYAMLALVVVRHQSSAAIIVGCLVFLGLTPFARELRSTAAWCPWFMGVHIGAFSLQVIVYQFFHKVIDFHALYGEKSRIFNDPQERASGLFQEPNSYCLTIFMLMAVCALSGRSSRWLSIVAAATMVASQSLWGVGAAVVGIALESLPPDGQWRRKILATTMDLAVVFGLSIGYLYVTTPAGFTHPPIFDRLTQLSDDTSVRERYVRNNYYQEFGPPDETAPPQPPIPVTEFTLPPFFRVLVGSGFSTHYFLIRLPANGFALLGKSFGILGSALLLLALIKTLQPLQKRQRWLVVLSLAFTMTNYPLFTYLTFWLWLGYLLSPPDSLANGLKNISPPESVGL